MHIPYDRWNLTCCVVASFGNVFITFCPFHDLIKSKPRLLYNWILIFMLTTWNQTQISLNRDSKGKCYILHHWFNEGYKIIRFLDLKIMLGQHYVLSNNFGSFIQKKLSIIYFLIISYYVNGQNKSICHICKYDVFTFVAFVESGNEIESQA